MRKIPSRTPSRAIQKALRSEVHFGCPRRNPDGSGCGSPILTFHHFDPPWAGNYIHNPDGMIALCPAHHKQADGGLWTNQQLREMKTTPFVDDAIKVQWPWTPENIVVKFGRSLVVGRGSPIRLFGKPIFEFSPTSVPDYGINQVSFESQIRDGSGNLWMSIRDNIFEIDLLNTTDLVFAPQTKSILATSADNTHLRVTYNRHKREDFIDLARSFMQNGRAFQTLGKTIERTGSVDSDGYINVVEVRGHFRTPDVEIELVRGEMYVRTLIPGMVEEIKSPSWIVSKENSVRLTLKNENDREFLRLG